LGEALELQRERKREKERERERETAREINVKLHRWRENEGIIGLLLLTMKW
jgi:hypothetical protein